MSQSLPSRRAFLRTGALSGLAVASGAAAAQAEETLGDALKKAGAGKRFEYEVTRTEEEWRKMLTPFEYEIMRDRGTEPPKTSPLWNEARPGAYSCKGCGLQLYQSDWKVQLDKGWVFFKHSDPNAVLTAIDGEVEYTGTGVKFKDVIEVHCRRCGSHLGHLLVINGGILHCINGTSLTFAERTA